MRTQAIEDYLKAIYELHEETGAVTTSALAKRLSPALPRRLAQEAEALSEG